jgi:hypothetical protein
MVTVKALSSSVAGSIGVLETTGGGGGTAGKEYNPLN